MVQASPHPTQPASDATPKRSPLWPGMVFLFIGIQFIWLSSVLYFALSDKTFSVEPDYYSKAVKWEDAQQQSALNSQLGWQIALLAGTPQDGGMRDVRLNLTTRDGRPISGATIEALYYHRAHAADRETVAFTATGDGESPGYMATIPMPDAGLYEFRITVTAQDVTYTQILVTEVF